MVLYCFYCKCVVCPTNNINFVALRILQCDRGVLCIDQISDIHDLIGHDLDVITIVVYRITFLLSGDGSCNVYKFI